MQTRGVPASPQAAIAAAYDLVDRGALAEAEAACRHALAATNGRSAEAWTALGVVLREQRRMGESEAAYRQALAVAPRHIPAHHNLGALLSHLERAEEALAALDRAQSLGLKVPELHINRGRALAQLYRYADAERAYARAVALQPRNVFAQSNLAQLRHKMGDPAFARDFAAAVAAHSGDVALQFNYGGLLQRSGDLVGAEAALRRLLQTVGPIPEARSALASVLHQSGRLQEAESEALAATMDRPQNPTLVANLVVIELALGKPDAALPFVRAQRQRQPDEQRWIAYEAVVARMMQDPLYRRLYDYERVVRTYELEPPPGWRSMGELNEALIAALGERHRLAAHPLDQSLRNGSQTSRSLLTETNDAIQGLIKAFAAPIESYRAAIGNSADHPLSARNRSAAALVGCWSVELRRDGFHVNHIHPEGWLSSAYYVAVPDEVADERLKSGWIKFGEPRFPAPGVDAEHFVQPRAGRLVLFPSYMWHGTNAISGDQPRLTVAFDAAPLGVG
jgi:Flp pilus assembly protein TadD